MMTPETERPVQRYTLQELVDYTKGKTVIPSDGDTNENQNPASLHLLNKDVLRFWYEDRPRGPEHVASRAHSRTETLLWRVFYGQPVRDMTGACRTQRRFKRVVDLYFMSFSEMRKYGKRHGGHRFCGPKAFEEIDRMLASNQLPCIEDVIR
jgi:hypothetical protein